MNQDIVNRLKQKYLEGRLPHAILLCGQNGLKEALNIAKYLFCENKDGLESCEICESCKKVNSLSHPDVMILGTSGETDSFRVDQIRQLCKDVYISANESDFKVYVLNNVQNMTLQAQNAFLKTLESPPDSVVFILISTDKNALIPTILSRVTILDSNDTELLSDKTKGSKNETYAIAKRIADSILSGNEYDILISTSKLYQVKERDYVIEVLSELKSILSELLCGKYRIENSIEHNKSDIYPAYKLCNIIDFIDSIIHDMEKNANKNILLTYFNSEVLLV